MNKYFLASLFAIIFLSFGLLTLSGYGINWDSPLRMIRGQTYLNSYLGNKNPEKTALVSPILMEPGEYVTRFDFLAGEGAKATQLPERPLLRREFENLQKNSGGRMSFYQDESWKKFFFNLDQNTGHPPLPEEIGAFFNKIFYQKLGVLGDIESFDLFPLLASAIGVFVVFLFTFEIAKSLKSQNPAIPAAVASISLALFPIFFADSHFNLKDPAQASFYAGSIWALWSWVSKNKLKYFFLFTAFVALALSVKWNVTFLPFIAIPWLFLIRKTDEFRLWFKPKKLIAYCLLLIAYCFAFLIIICPASWPHPAGWLWQTILFYKNLGISPNNIQPDGFIWAFGINFYPAILLFSQTPEIIILLVTASAVSLLKNGQDDKFKSLVLIFLWLLVPLARSFLPEVKSYGGIRQYMEVLPALAILSGLGASYLIQKLKFKRYVLLYKIGNYKSKFKTFNFLIALLPFEFCLLTFSVLLFPLFRLHPNENIYFNTLVGGTKGAQKHNLIDLAVSYGNVYKQATDWLNKNVEPDANLTILDGYMFAASPLWLRPDISISPYHFSGFEQKDEYIFSLYRPNKEAVFAQIYPLKFLKPVHKISVDGVPLLYIYKNDSQNTLPGFKDEKSINNPSVLKINLPQGAIQYRIDLGRELKVTRLIVSPISENCRQSIPSAFVDELVTFIPNNLNVKRMTYGINEKKIIQNSLEISFPAENARMIIVTPKTDTSCFLDGKVSEVKFLP